jgi:hypothetical protein
MTTKPVITRNIAVFTLLLVSLFALFVLPAYAAAQTPTTYWVTETNAMFGVPMNVEVYRDGNQAIVDSSSAPSAAGSKGIHTRTLYDLQAGRSYTADLNNPSVPCGATTFSGDWGDPFAFSQEVLGDLANKNPKTLGTETLAGVTTKLMQVQDPAGKMNSKVWVDEQHKLVVKLQMIPAGGAAQTVIEVKQLSLTKPAASVFTMPAGCAGVASQPAPPTEGQRIASETGGNSSDYTNAIMPPPSKNSCSVLFKVVQAGSMQPITSGFQVALDTQVDTNHMAAYSTNQDQRGHVTFSGGNIHEMTSQLRNGVLRIDNVPPQFNIELYFGQAGDSSALIYRQCYGPQTTLLLVVKNRQKLSDGADWLWSKK